MASDVSDLTRSAHEWTVKFLSEHLPTICGEDWWEKGVRWKLSVPQERALDERGIKTLAGLDLAALLRVLEKNWRELSLKLQLPRDGRTLVNEVRNVRNRLAHESLAGIDIEDRQRDSDTLARYLALLGADSTTLQEARTVRDELRRRMANGQAVNAEQTRVTAGAEEPDGETEAPAGETPQAGVPLYWLKSGVSLAENVCEALGKATYVGIDFGTSTTVVSIATGAAAGLGAEPVPITQQSDTGAEIEDHLVPTCLAWTGDRLLVGHGAANLKSELMEGRNVWTSFKMRLGINLGPQYPNTMLPRGQGVIAIEHPQDAARIFFEFIRQSVEDHVQSHGLPSRIYYAVSVPAAFEANQRQDLMNALAEAGIPVEESGLIDEPNAAFLSYLVNMERGSDWSRFVDSLSQKARRVLVFDFGAGTCDISVLEVMVENERLTSRNLGISKFMALGGDDIDRAIARQVLLPQLCNGGRPSEAFTTNELETLVLPRLKPAAEELKVACSKIIEQQGLTNLVQLRGQTNTVTGGAIPPLSVQGRKWELKQPTIALSQFADVMSPFLSGTATAGCTPRDHCPSVVEPIDGALDKAKVTRDNLDMVLFIGGSCENPLVRQCVESHLGRFVDCVVPRDLRSHVSLGAAIHSLFVHGLGWELIRPITSEDIYVVTRNGGLERVLPAGTAVPSPDIAVNEFTIERDGQELVELPLCVSGRDKILAVLSIPAPNPPGSFNAGDKVRLSCSITREKLLKVRVRVGAKSVVARIISPLANAELAETDRRVLQARQALNESILAGHGRPSVLAILNYAQAARSARRWREAAEMLEAGERLDSESDHANTIGCYYWKAKDYSRSLKWARIAYERKPGRVELHNMALNLMQAGDTKEFEKLMEEALRLDGKSPATLQVYGDYLMRRADPRGVEYLQQAFDRLYPQLSARKISEEGCSFLEQAATALGKRKIAEEAQAYRESLQEASALFEEGNLVRGAKDVLLKFDEGQS